MQNIFFTRGGVLDRFVGGGQTDRQTDIFFHAGPVYLFVKFFIKVLLTKKTKVRDIGPLGVNPPASNSRPLAGNKQF